MPAQRLSKEKRGYVIGALVEGTPINAVCRMFKVTKRAVLRVIEETGAALGDYMHSEFRDIPCARLEIDEQWQYVGKHGQRMSDHEQATETTKGDFWLWAAIDPDTKLVVSHRIARRDWNASEDFIAGLADRITGPVQVSTDRHRSYGPHLKAYFPEGFSHATDDKQYEETRFNPEGWSAKRRNGIPKAMTSTRQVVTGYPDLRTVTISHVERVFLTVRQEVARFGRQTLAYSKKLSMHRAAIAMHLGIYNLCRKHTTLGTTPAVAAGIEERPWTIEMVVDLTDAYTRRMEDEKFEAAFAAL